MTRLRDVAAERRAAPAASVVLLTKMLMGKDVSPTADRMEGPLSDGNVVASACSDMRASHIVTRHGKDHEGKALKRAIGDLGFIQQQNLDGNKTFRFLAASAIV